MKLLKEMLETMSVSGHEENLRALIKREAEPYADEIKTDVMGNLIAIKRGKNPDQRFMLSAHMDEIGLIASYIDDKGFVRAAAVGGVSPAFLNARLVRFSGGALGVVMAERKKDKDKQTEMSDLYIDVGASDKESAGRLVKPGEVAAPVGTLSELGGRLCGKSMDNKIGCYVLLSVLKELEGPFCDVYFTFSSQEEVGLRGAKTAAHSIMPHYALAVDVTSTGDVPEAQKLNVCLGGGAAVKFYDRSVICHPAMTAHLLKAAERENIKVQAEVLDCGGTDAGVIHVTGGGTITGGVSIPARYIHSPLETVDAGDIKSCIKLIKAAVKKEIGEGKDGGK